MNTKRCRIIRRHIEPLDPRRPLPEGLDWYVLTTEPKREFHVAHWLEDSGWSSLVPLQYRLRAVTRHGRGRNVKRNRVEMPLIPRIVIVGFSEAVPWLQVGSHRHVTGVLGVNGMPIAMRRGEAERLQRKSAELLLPKKEIQFKPGDQAKVPRVGWMEEHHRIVEIASIQGKWATVIQSWFGTARGVKVAVDDLEAA